jgi:hypothetical protein
MPPETSFLKKVGTRVRAPASLLRLERAMKDLLRRHSVQALAVVGRYIGLDHKESTEMDSERVLELLEIAEMTRNAPTLKAIFDEVMKELHAIAMEIEEKAKAAIAPVEEKELRRA